MIDNKVKLIVITPTEDKEFESVKKAVSYYFKGLRKYERIVCNILSGHRNKNYIEHSTLGILRFKKIV